MTDQEFTESQATLVQLDTEIASCRQGEQESIEQARKWNDTRRAHTAKRSELERLATPLRQAVVAHAQELRRLAAEKAQAEAEARARAAAEARDKAAAERKAAEQGELQKAQAEIAELKAQLAKEPSQ